MERNLHIAGTLMDPLYVALAPTTCAAGVNYGR